MASSVRTASRLENFNIKFNIDPSVSKTSIQVINPSYDSWFRGIASSIFCKYTGFNLGFGCAQYDPAPESDMAIGYHNTINHQIQVCLARWIRFYVGGHVLGKLSSTLKLWSEHATKDQIDGDFTDLKNDGTLVPSPESLLAFYGDVYAARMTEFLPSNSRPRIPEDVISKSTEFFSPPSSSVWSQRVNAMQEAEYIQATIEFVERYMSFVAKSVVVFIQDPRHEKENVSINMFNATSLYHGSIPFPPDSDKYPNKNMSICKFIIGPYYVPSVIPRDDTDCLNNFICLLRAKHTFKSGAQHNGFYMMLPVLYDPENRIVVQMMARRRNYRQITETLVQGISKSFLIRIRMNYADLEIYDGPAKAFTKPSKTKTAALPASAVPVPTSSSFSDDENDDNDSIEKKASMDSKVRNAFKTGFSRQEEKRKAELAEQARQAELAEQARQAELDEQARREEQNALDKYMETNSKSGASVRGGNSIRGPGSVSGGASVRGGDSVRGPGSVSGGASVRGPGSVSGGDSIRGGGSVRGPVTSLRDILEMGAARDLSYSDDDDDDYDDDDDF